MKLKNLILSIITSSFLLGCTGDAYTQLQLASSRGETDLMKEMLAQGADVNEVNKHGKTALMLAAGTGRVDAVKLLLEHKAALDTQEIDGMTALIMAASDGQAKTAKLLIDSGADINMMNYYGATAMTNAAFFNHEEVVKELLNSTQVVGKDTNENALLLTAGLGLENIMQMLLDYGVDVNARGKKDRTPLMAAIEFDKINTVKLLLKNGANINVKDTDGESVMQIAEDNGNKEIIALLKAK